MAASIHDTVTSIVASFERGDIAPAKTHYSAKASLRAHYSIIPLGRNL